MGIYDRDYVRREGPSFLGSFVERGRVCKWLIGINVAVFVAQILTLPAGAGPVVDGLGWLTDAFQLDVDHVLHGQVWRLLTYAFLHDPGGIMHILLNMLFLWWFGGDVEDLYGPREFLLFYLSACFVGGVAFLLSSVAWLPAAKCFGASGGVLAVLTLCAFHYPRRVILLFFILPVPIWLFLIVFLAGDAFVFLHKGETDTAVAAHLGGALFGGVYYQLHWRLSSWRFQLPTGWRRMFRPKLRIYREEVTRTPVGVSATPAPPDDEQLEAKMDAILEKISRVGTENLTDSERLLLMRASEVLRRRRR